MYRDCAAVVHGLDLPEPFDLQTLCDRIGDSRGRPILLAPISLPTGGPCGLWIATDPVDYIFYEAQTSPLHQRHIVLHEIGHLLCDHHAAPVLSEDASRLLLPSLDPGMVRRVLGRGCYSAVEEQQAEIIASLVIQRTSSWRAEPVRPVPPEAAELVRRIERALAGQVS
ncbi:ImmA/IrrE family metallo-endopeptidase [Crossiella equi]|uniref:ImmA/IrrE family metallo-endopeptidase n=1 Tax=Crossiella equi TaxID=130796 RepID=UPI0035571A40